MKLDTTSQQTQQDQNLLQSTPIHTQNIDQKRFTTIAMVVVVLLVLVVAGVYFLNTKDLKNFVPQQPANQLTVIQTSPTIAQAQLPITNRLGLTTWSLTNTDNGPYLRQTIDITSDKAEYYGPPSKARTIIKVYSEDKNYNPLEITSSGTSKYNWSDILKEPIIDSTGSASILVSDRIFSFKRIPNSNNFMFVVELNRSASVSTNGPWIPYQVERDLYLYDQSRKNLKKIATFPNNTTKYSYPKIYSFSQDGKYAYIQLFGCWSCGGHVPENFLVNLESFKTLNMVRTSYFAWKQNGNFEYKDYVVIECKEPEQGDCSQDPNSLPLKTGKI